MMHGWLKYGWFLYLIDLVVGGEVLEVLERVVFGSVLFS